MWYGTYRLGEVMRLYVCPFPTDFFRAVGEVATVLRWGKLR